ncbi:MAG: DUF4019 domain-containing protein [Pseudomonadota bacterium]
MADAIDDLTDKEKQALRLLLAGHDAKSAALELDISVHTLNDRLRAARRKLGVTTSKEAARALGQAEQSESEPAPQSFVHKPLGVQENPENQHLSSVADRSEGGIIAFAARRKGLLIMSLTLALALTAVAFIPSQNPSATPAVVSDDSAFMAERPSASELQARRFLGLIDFGKFDESYAEAGEPLREQYALGKWKFGLTLRMTKGKIQDRTLATVIRTSEFGGRKGGEFEVITFNSLFQHNNQQIERVVLERIGADWKVVDYEITAKAAPNP